VLINGVTVTVKVAHVRLCHSRMLFVRAYPRETREMVFDAHDRAFAFFKGTCTGYRRDVRAAAFACVQSR
jgi:transposase